MSPSPPGHHLPARARRSKSSRCGPGYGSASEIAACAPAGHIALIRRGPSDGGQKAIAFADKVENARAAEPSASSCTTIAAAMPLKAGRLLSNIEVGSVAPSPHPGHRGWRRREPGRSTTGRRRAALLAGQHRHRSRILDGTSMASPLAAGVAAPSPRRYPGLSNVALRQLLQETATDLGAPAAMTATALAPSILSPPFARPPRLPVAATASCSAKARCDGPLVSRALPSCDDLGYDSVAGGSVTCNRTCSGIDGSARLSACRARPV